MVFKCQENSFLKEFATTVVSCEKSKFTLDNLTQPMSGFNVVLKDTILFPEGGGQPCDYGQLNEKPVWNVIRSGSEAIHFVESDEPFEIGTKVLQKLNWTRRFDHMQQHSGQHLITALFDQEYGYDTRSWWLGTDSSYIELNAKEVTKEQLRKVELMANELIIEGRKVEVAVTTKEEGLQFQDIRAPRGLPVDHVGPVRVVSIEGIESNMCCGTHITNLFQLQGVKLLHVEKAKSKLLVHFLVGGRIIRKLDDCYAREVQFNAALKGGPASHLDLVQKLQSNSRIIQKSFQKILKDIAMLEAEKLKQTENLPKYFSLHRSDGIEPDFCNAFLRNAPDGVFYFLTVSDSTGKGHLLIKSDKNQAELVQKFGLQFLEILEGKGNGKGNQFQGKINKIHGLSECEVILKNYFDQI